MASNKRVKRTKHETLAFVDRCCTCITWAIVARKHYSWGSFILIVLNNVFICVIWPLLVKDLDDFQLLNLLWDARLVSKSLKDFAGINLLWLAHQVAKGDISASTIPMLDVEESFAPQALTFNIWK